MKENSSDNDMYEIIENLGEGAFGTCYKVLNKNDNNIYVMKNISIKNIEKDKLENIRQEAKILSTLDSEYIVKYYDSFEDENYFSIIMEYCEGLDLYKYLDEHRENKKLLDKNIIYHIISNICLGLKEIHNKKLVHRDIKPQNLFLTKNLTVKIGDFGVAKKLSFEEKYAKTQVGTMMYMAPEILKGDEYNEKVDIWALGCIIYELCTLKYCFQDENMLIFMEKVTEAKYENINEDIYGEDLSTLIKLMLTPDYKNRPSANNIIKMINDLNIDFSLDKIKDFFEIDESYQNYLIESNIKYSINKIDYTVLSRTRKLSKIKYYGGLVAINVLGSFFTGGLSTMAALGIHFGLGGIGNYFLNKFIGQDKKENFINENCAIIKYIENNLENVILKRLDKELLKEKIIIYNKENLNEQIKKIKEKLISPKYINKLKDIVNKNFNILVLGCKNSGKTTLINTFLNIDEDGFEKLSIGENNDEDDFEPFFGNDDKIKYTLYESKGVDNKDNLIENKINNIILKIKKRKEINESNQLIHCIWYCFKNFEENDKIFIQKILKIYYDYNIPLIFVHTETFSQKQSIKCKNEMKEYLNKIIKDEKEVEKIIKNYVDVLAIGEEEEEIEGFGIDNLEKVTKKEIEEKGLKSSYYEFIKKEIMIILINGSFNFIFNDNNIKLLTNKAKEDLEKYLDSLKIILNNDKLNLSEEIKEKNIQSMEKLFNSFNIIKDSIKDELKNMLKKENLIKDNENFVQDIYSRKNKKFKEKYNYNKFCTKVENLIYDSIEKKKKEIINNSINSSFNFYVIQIIKEGIKEQFVENNDIINDIYKELLK